MHFKAHLLDLHAPVTRANKIEGTCVHIKAHLLDLHAPVTRANKMGGLAPMSKRMVGLLY